jgi:transposase InsO family protein
MTRTKSTSPERNGTRSIGLGQRHDRISLRNVEYRVLLPAGVAHKEKAARIEVGKWIEDRRNRRRRHASIGQISPVAFELQYSRQIADSQKVA